MLKNNSKWNKESKELIRKLHKELSLNHNNWHQKKGDPDIRAAELISSALVQLMNGGKTQDIDELINQASKWLKGELKDSGCPNRH